MIDERGQQARHNPSTTRVRRDIATDAAAHALRLLEKIRTSTQRPGPDTAGEQAGKPHAIVIGGGISGLVAAHELQQTGHRVTVLEAAADFGGCLRRMEVAGLQLDAGAESFAVRSNTVAEFLQELDMGQKIVPTSGMSAWLTQQRDEHVESHPMPASSLMGIPSQVRSDEVRALIGRPAVVRAAADLVTPMPKKWATEKLSVGEVVRQRMGSAVLEQLVAPVVAGVYSTDPNQVDIDAAAPGLRQAMQDTGSLARAVAQLQGQAPAGSRVAGLQDGMYTLITELTAQLREAGVNLVRNAPVTALAHDPQASEPFTVTSHTEVLHADKVVVATQAAAAAPLLQPLLPAGTLAGAGRESNSIALVILVVDKPELDEAPRGSGVLVTEGSTIKAKALTHSTAKWPWLGDATGPGTHVVRLSYGRIGHREPLVEAGNDAALTSQAIADAATILGVDVGEDDVLGSAVSRFSDMVPLTGNAQRQANARLDEALQDLQGLSVVGAWRSGTGLARVIAHTRAQVAISAS